MSEKYKFRNPDGIYFITPTLTDWVDLFSRQIYCHVVLDSLKYCQREKGLQIHAWCIMTNHLHLIVSRNGHCELSSIVRDFKKFSSVKIIETMSGIHESRKRWLLEIFRKSGAVIKRNHKYKVWRDGNHPVELVNNAMIDQRLNYLHMNPVKAGIVNRPEHYIYSSAADYMGDVGLLEIEKLN